VASFAIVINAVFLHFDRRIYEPEQLSAKLHRTQQSLKVAESGPTRTPIPAQGGQHSGDCGQQVKAA
jgi:hypothetical protein